LRLAPAAAFDAATAPVVYILLESLSTTLWLLVILLPRQRSRQQIADVMRSSKLDALRVGVLIYVTYGLVLSAMAFVDNVSYVVAFRQLSIPLGVILGITLLKEPCPRPRALGVAVLFSGLLLVGFG
jgi:uncharacterized membrane protein